MRGLPCIHSFKPQAMTPLPSWAIGAIVLVIVVIIVAIYLAYTASSSSSTSSSAAASPTASAAASAASATTVTTPATAAVTTVVSTPAPVPLLPGLYNGMLVIDLTGRILLLQNGQQRWYPNPTVYAAASPGATYVTSITAAEAAAIPMGANMGTSDSWTGGAGLPKYVVNGMLVIDTTGMIYQIVGNQKCPIPTPAIMSKNFPAAANQHVIHLTAADIAAIPTGPSFA